MPNQAPAHWSKDFVEHLRTVHFALIAISAGLILLIQSSQSYSPRIANRELAQIEQLSKTWTRGWVVSRADVAGFGFGNVFPAHFNVYGLRSNNTVSLNLRDPGTEFSGIVEEVFHDEVSGQVIGKKRRSSPTKVVFPGSLWNIASYREKHQGPELTSFPKSLAEFREWWNSLADKDWTVLIPYEVEDTGTSIINLKTNVTKNVRLDSTHAKEFSQTFTAFLEPTCCGISPVVSIDQELFEFDVGNALEISITQQGFVKVFPDWQSGAFKTSFYDLDAAAHEYETLGFDQVSKLLSDDSPRGSEVFEAFGLKFPAGQITVWGDVLLLGVQLYFLIYLRQLSGKLNADDAGWDVPWIGMNSSALSAVICFFTFAVLPVFTAICVGWQGAIRAYIGYLYRTDNRFWFHLRSMPWTWHYSAHVKVALLILAVFGSGYLGILCWKYRPQIAPEPPSCPAQMFE